MSCSPFDLRDYFMGELAEADRRQVELHGRSCAACREELDRLRVTGAALLAWRDEEIPQRIGFVSDRVYEPSALRRWWQAFWGSAPRLGFASAAMLSAAIVIAAIGRPAPMAPPAAPARDAVSIQASVSQQVNAAVEKAVAASEAQNRRETAELLSAASKRFEAQRRADMERVAQNFAIVEKYARREYRAAVFGDVSR